MLVRVRALICCGTMVINFIRLAAGAIDVEVEAVGKIVVVIHRNGIWSDERAEGGLVHSAASIVHRGNRGLVDALRLDDAGCADCDANRSILLEDPVHDVVIVADDGSLQQHRFSARLSVDGIVFEVAPRRVAGGALEHAGGLRLADRACVVGWSVAGEVSAVLGTARLGRAVLSDHPAGTLRHRERLASSNTSSGSMSGTEHPDSEPSYRAGSQLVAVLVADQVHHCSHTLIEAEPEVPVLPTHFTFVDLVCRAHRLHGDDRRIARAGCGIGLLEGRLPGWNGDSASIDHIEHLLGGDVRKDMDALNRATPAMVCTMNVGALSPSDALAILLRKDPGTDMALRRSSP